MIPAHFLVHVVGKSIAIKVNGCIVKRATCQNCRQEYIYQLRRKAEGNTYALFHLHTKQKELEAQSKAQKKLDAKLAKEVDPVPCPACGTLQPDMIRTARLRNLKILLITATFTAIPIAIFWYAAADQWGPQQFLPWIQLTALSAAAIYFLLTIYFLLKNLNANPHHRTRESLGQKCRAMPAAEFDALMNGQT